MSKGESKVPAQSGFTNVKIDKRLKGKNVGWRRSKTGNVYYENRKNRSDVSIKKKL